MSARRRGGGRGLRLAIAALLVAAFALAVRAGALVAAQRVALRVVLEGALGPLAAGLFVAAALCALALALELRELVGEPRPRPSAAPLADLGVVLVACWVAVLALAQPFQRLWLQLALGLAAGAWAALVLLGRVSTAPRRARRQGLVRRAALALCAALVLVELGLRAAAAVHPAPLLARTGEAPRTLVERFRCAPGELRFGFPCNARGFYDEPLERGAVAPVVAVGDSFFVGAVPHPRHLTTVCERELGVPVHSIGVAGIAPPEYLHLLVEEALPLAPAAAVVGVFVGNDLSFASVGAELPDPGLRSWFSRERVLTWLVARRLARTSAERWRTGEQAVAAVQGAAGGQGVDPAELDERFPWLADPLLEQPSLSEEAFLRLETERALEVCRGVPVAFGAAVAALREARRVAGATPLCVLLIPDEFQVEDDLWRRVRARAGIELDRDLPQRLLLEALAAESIPVLDLLPVLRAVPPLADGNRHLYHLRDTHFNARGNRAAGEALADFLRPLLAE